MSTGELFDGQPVIKFGHETDRRNFMRWAGLVGVGASLAAGTAFGIPGVASAADSNPFADGDLGILQYALTLEYLESDFYMMGLKAGLLSGRDLELVTPIGSHEMRHVAEVTAAITGAGGTPVAKPKITYPSGTFSSRDKFLGTASTFEELGVVAYHGQVPRISSLKVLAAAASIAGVESRHAAILAQLTGGQPFPHPIEEHEPMSYVLAKVKPFLS